jgi:arsenite methyltransferase
VSGALAERAFAAKIEKMGFRDVWIGERIPYGVEQAALYPLFTPALIELMRELIPPDRQATVAVSVIAKARKGEMFDGKLG